MGQTPPPWHGQAVATQILFDHDWPGFEVHRLRMEFSEEMMEVGRFQWKKIRHLFLLIVKARRILKENPGCVLFYPPASAKWVPFVRDVIFLTCVRHLAGSTVFIFHASGLPVFVSSGLIRRILGRLVYHHVDMALEVAQEKVTPHEVFAAKAWQWCPCAIEVPELALAKPAVGTPFTVLFVASLQEGKGLLEILRTASILKKIGKEHEFRFRIVGKWFSTEFEQDVRHLCGELELGEMVELVGQLTGDEKWRAYAESDVFFFPTHYASEATPIVLMEALGMGLPILSTEWAGIPAMLKGCESAVILPIKSPEKYAEALLAMSGRRDESIDLAKISKKFYQQHFLPTRFIERVEKAFLQTGCENIEHRSEESEIQHLSSSISKSKIQNSKSSSSLSDPSDLAFQPSSSSEEDSRSQIVDRRSENPTQSGNPESASPPSVFSVPFDSNVLDSQFVHLRCAPVVVESSSSSSNSESKIQNSESSSSPSSIRVHPRPSAVQSSSSSTPPLITDDCSLGTSSFSSHADGDKSAAPGEARPTVSSSQHFSVSASKHLLLTVYLADQNPGHDRSFGISRMSQIVLDTLHATGRVDIETIASKTSQQGSECIGSARILPWGTRRKWVRLLTDHFHPLFHRSTTLSDVYYFPKGYLPLIDVFCQPSVVTIHDTIIQYDADHYPKWRSQWEYGYWSRLLKHTLRKADKILTVSESSKSQIQVFMDRHQIPRKEITVTYEPCMYEKIPQPENPAKENYVIHLASCEPHKRTAHLIRWWHEAEKSGRTMPMLHLIGQIPPDVSHLLASSHSMVKRPFLEDSALQATYQEARALILPSEIEGFGLPALEAYYLGTPVCYVKGTSVEEVLCTTTRKGGFSLDSAESLFFALDEVMAMGTEETRECGLKLRETYSAEKVVERMLSVFHKVKN